MSKRRKVKQGDPQRSIITELLPYEVPLRISALHLYANLHKKQRMGAWFKKLFASKKGDAIPFCYKIRTGDEKCRTLGLIHPILFERAATIYANYADVIISLCEKSKWTLRRPVSIAKMYYDTEDRSQAEEQGQLVEAEDGVPDNSVEEEGVFQEHASSYFAYASCSFLHRFFESNDFLSLERRFAHYRRLDIAKCFDNIYTHTFSWAVKGKAAAKSEKGMDTFDGFIDLLMRTSNHGETHGILVGSELARIFAEVILQEVDVRAAKKLSSLNVDNFAVRRYIDDYFLFFDDPKRADLVQTVIEACLREFKLYLNEAKTTECHRPFVTKITAAKIQIGAILKREFNFDVAQIGADIDSARKSLRRQCQSRKIVRDVRLAAAETGVDYSDISAFVLKNICSLIAKKRAVFAPGEESHHLADIWLCCVIEVAFFFFSVDVRFRTSVLSGRIVSDICNLSASLPDGIKHSIHLILARECVGFLQIVADASCAERLEIANFLVCLSDVSETLIVPEDLLVRLFDLHSPCVELDYFSIVSLYFFMRDRAHYANLRQQVEGICLKKILRCDSILDDTEIFCLGLDMLSCPWLGRDKKREIARKFVTALKSAPARDQEAGAFTNEMSRYLCLFDWRPGVPNSFYLAKKEIAVAY